MARVSKLKGIYREQGLINTVGALASYTGQAVDDLCKFLEEDMEGARKYDISLSERIWAWKHGFTARTYAMYDLRNSNPEQYIDNVTKLRSLTRLNKPLDDLTRNKAAFHSWFQNRSKRIPTLFGLISDGTYISYDSDISNFFRLLKSEGKLVLKPIKAHRGDGVKIVTLFDDQLVVNGTNRTTADLSHLISSLNSYVVTQFVNQAQYAATINPSTTNTIRLLTIKDPATNEPFVAAASHRFGTEESEPVDSWSKGGVAAPIEPETGVMEEVFVQGSSSGLQRRETHPLTGEPISEVTVPEWEKICTTTLEFARDLRGAPYLGWDVILSPDGPVVIEANSPSDPDVLQVDGGLLEDDRIRESLGVLLS